MATERDIPPAGDVAHIKATLASLRRDHAKMKQDISAASRLVADSETMRVKTFNMVFDMHQALMEPQPGHANTLLDRMAAVTIQIESGERSMDRLMKLAAWGKALLWFAGILAAGYAAIKFGIGIRE